VATISFIDSPEIPIVRRNVHERAALPWGKLTGPMELFLLRHGEAGKRVPVASRDAERGLTEAGKQEIREVGDSLAGLELKFDLVATSPLKRAKETASIVNKSLDRKGPVEDWAELSPEGSKEALVKRLGKLKAGSSVLLVGHEPYLTTLVGQLAGRGGKADGGIRVVLKKGGLARLSVTGTGGKLTGELRWLLTPKQIRKMG
jgi:phosphohistidine phosphatase